MDKITKIVYNKLNTCERTVAMYIHDASRDITNFESDRPLALHSCGIQNPRQDSLILRPEGRLDWHIIFVIEGECMAEYGGRDTLLSKKYFVIYPPHARQKYSYSGEKPTRAFWLHFGGTEVRHIMEDCGLGGGVYHSQSSAELRALFPPMIREYRTKQPLWELRGAGLLAQLLSELARSISNDRRMDDFVAALVEHIHDDCASDIDISNLAAQAGFSRSHFDYLFRTQVGTSPHRYLLEVRLKEASWLLRHTDLPVAAVALQVGFPDPFYFSRLYKKHYGISPKEERAQGNGSPSTERNGGKA